MNSKLDGMTVETIWLEIDKKLNENPEPYQDMNTTYSFNLSGEDGGQFGLKFTNGHVETIIGMLDEADCTLSLSVKDFKKLLDGNLNTSAAYMMGKLKVQGNLGEALKIEKLLKKYSF